VVRLAPGDWQTYRDVRLAMLQESPTAFGSTLAEAARNEERHWRQRLTDNVVFLARVGGAPAGSAIYSTTIRASNPDDCGLYGMWVDPRFRAAGVGRALVDAVVEQARASGKDRVVLHVMTGNAPASELYLRAGFLPTGRTVPHPHDDHILEAEMELVLSDDRHPPSPGEVT
jgi:ribosomal protein S18 acetylase RimI-like enzyme